MNAEDIELDVLRAALKEQAKSECGPEMAMVLEEMLGRSMLEIQTTFSKGGSPVSVWSAYGAAAMLDRISGVTSEIQRIILEMFVDGDLVFYTQHRSGPGIHWVINDVGASAS